MHKTLIRLSIPLLLMMIVATGFTSQAVAQSADKQIDKLIARAGGTIDAISAAKLQIGTTVDDYNEILDGKAADNRAAYKKLQKALNKSEKAAVAVGTQVDKMEVVANDYFTSWEASLSEFTSDDMRARSEKRMQDTRERYDGILAAGREAGEAFRPFVTQLKDQILFLGHDLNPSAIEDLAGDAKKLNEQADEVFERVDKTIETAREYQSSLKPD